MDDLFKIAREEIIENFNNAERSVDGVNLNDITIINSKINKVLFSKDRATPYLEIILLLTSQQFKGGYYKLILSENLDYLDDILHWD